MQYLLSWFKKKSIRQKLATGTTYLLVGIGAFFFVLPLFWMISTSLKSPIAAIKFPPTWIPEQFIWGNYAKVFTIIPFGLQMFNTAIIASLAVVGEVLSGATVAFGFARLRAPGRGLLFILVLSTLMIPYQVRLIPLYTLFRHLGWLNTWKPLWVPAYFGGNAFYIFLMRQYFRSIPSEIDGAARIDGAGTFQIFYRIILPMSMPVLATVAMFSFVFHWNAFLGPLIYLDDPHKFTVTLGLLSFQDQTGAGSAGTEWPLMMAVAFMTVIPPLVIFFLAQKIFIRGIVITGLKE